MRKVNLTLSFKDDDEAKQFEDWLSRYIDIDDIIYLTDTKELYENDTHFKKLTSEYYRVKKLRNDYINEHL